MNYQVFQVFFNCLVHGLDDSLKKRKKKNIQNELKDKTGSEFITELSHKNMHYLSLF